MADGWRALAMDLRALVLLSLLPLALSGCSDDGGGDDHGHGEVAIENNAFSPKTVTVSAGGGIIWTNHDSAMHSAVSDDTSNAWHTDPLSQHEEQELHFDEEGTFPYHCGIHPSMKGTVVVE